LQPTLPLRLNLHRPLHQNQQALPTLT
jgi:hypothetical protein